MNKRLRILGMMLAVTLSCHHTLLLVNAENITPIESVDWIDSDESSTEDSAVTSEEINETESEDIDVSEPTSSDHDEGDMSEDIGQSPVALITAIQLAEQRSFEYVNFVSENEAISVVSHHLMKDHDRYYLSQMAPPFLPYTQYLMSDRDSIGATYISVDDLATYAADGMNTQPQIYEGTVVHDFYTVAQEQYDQLSGKFVQVEPDQLLLSDVAMDLYELESYLLEVLGEWIADESVQANMVETELGYQIDIVGEAGAQFQEIIQAHLGESDNLNEFVSQFPNGYEGTVMLNFEENLVGIGLISQASDTQVSGVEFYFELSDEPIEAFTEENVLILEEFVDLVGFDAISEINAFESTLTADMFVLTEGTEPPLSENPDEELLEDELVDEVEEATESDTVIEGEE